jgi:hypothetical protein
MRAAGLPPDLAAVGYGAADVAPLVTGTLAQQRLLANAPCPIDGSILERLFTAALSARDVAGVTL